METKYQSMIQNPRRLRAMTGLELEQFKQLLPYFEDALYGVMDGQTMDGYAREGRRFTPYKNSPLPTVADKQLFILTYLRTNPIQEVQGQIFGMGQSNVSKWFHILHEVLNRALDQQGFLPARDSDELEAWLQQATVDESTPEPSESTGELSASDGSPPFSFKTARNDQSVDRSRTSATFIAAKVSDML